MDAGLLGNWSTVKTDANTSGTYATTEDRSHNLVNELTVDFSQGQTLDGTLRLVGAGAAGAAPAIGAAARSFRGADDAVEAVDAGISATRSSQELAKAGRTGRQARLRELVDDPSVSSADRGWIRQEMNSINRGQRSSIRVPPGKVLAHRRGFEAKKGFNYKHSDLQDVDIH